VFTLDSFSKITVVAQMFWANLYSGKSYAQILAKNVLGHILGVVFPNSSGHPGREIESRHPGRLLS
jgi:hypothetical protein